MLKKHFFSVIKFGFVAGLMFYLAQKGLISFHALQHAFQNVHQITLAIALIIINQFLGATRWALILWDQGSKITFREVINLHLIGNFFNTTLPGAVTGDVFKAYYLSDQKAANSVFSVVFDRLLGLWTLIVVAGCAAWLGQSELHFPEGRYLPWLLLGCFILYALLFLPDQYDFLKKFFVWAGQKLPMLNLLTSVYMKFKAYRNKKITFYLVLLSLAIHILGVEIFICFAKALGEQGFSRFGMYVVTPFVFLICSIPIGPGGLGTGNLAFLYLGQKIGIHNGADLFNLSAVINILFALPGGLLYLKKSRQVPVALKK